MSDALDYLLQVRPEAMKSYFGFLREAGRHLDPRTRAIISVLTKVDNRTEAGFRQYVMRALREGVTADELLDAMLVAFPTLGLSKIVWAVDRLLEMDIPDFRPERLGRGEEWHDVIPSAELDGRRLTRTACDGRELFLYCEEDGLRVYDSRCPHQATNIPGSAAVGDILTCPKHGWQFDLRSGDCIAKGDRPLVQLQHKVEDGRVYVKW